MITPDSPDRVYSTRLRTALVLAGSGTAGAYHAGVLRALHEAGIKIDLVAGRGIGAMTALFAAVDGGSRLWEANGLWKSGSAAGFYGWRGPLRAAGWSMIAAMAILAIPLLLLATAVIVGSIGLLLTLVGLEGPGTALSAGFGRWIAVLFSADSLPTVIPRLVLFAVIVAALMLVGGAAARVRARARQTAYATGHGVDASRRAALGRFSLCPCSCGVVESDPRGSATGGAAAPRARASLRRAPAGESGSTGLPGTAHRRARHGRTPRSRLRPARRRTPLAVLRAARRWRERDAPHGSLRSRGRRSRSRARCTCRGACSPDCDGATPHRVCTRRGLAWGDAPGMRSPRSARPTTRRGGDCRRGAGDRAVCLSTGQRARTS